MGALANDSCCARPAPRDVGTAAPSRRRSAHGEVGVKPSAAAHRCASTVTRCPRPAAHPVLFRGPYLVNPERGLILRTASRLDAVSAYPDPT